MIFFIPARLLVAKNNCPEALEGIAQALGPSEAEFREAVEAGNTELMDQLVEKSIQTYTGQDNIIYGLRLFCEKFDIEPASMIGSERDFFDLICENKDTISQKLEEKGF